MCHARAGVAASWLGELAHARKLSEAAAALSSSCGDHAGVSRALRQLGEIAMRTSEMQFAERVLRSAVQYAATARSRLGVISALTSLGALFNRGDVLPAAMAAFDRHHGTRCAAGNGRGHGACRALQSAAVVRLPTVEAQTLQDMAEVEIRLNKLSAAESHARASLHLFESAGLRLGVRIRSSCWRTSCRAAVAPRRPTHCTSMQATCSATAPTAWVRPM